MNNKIYLILFLLLPFLFVNEIKALDFAIKGITVEAPFPHEVKKFCDHIKNDLAPSGVNTLMLRIDYKFKFQSYPQVAHDSALTVSQVKEILTTCKQANIRLVPLMTLFSQQSTRYAPHGLLKAFPEFDETPWLEYGPNAPYLRCYCPNHPQLHTVVFSLIDEIINAFESKEFCPGIDELMYIGEDERCKSTGKSKAQLLADEVNKLNAHVKSRGNKMWIWGDRLLKADDWGMSEWEASIVPNTWDALQMIDKDVVILDWHYRNLHLSTAHFVFNGFNTIVCPAGTPEIAVEYLKNLARFSKSTIQKPAMRQKFNGFIVTHWGRCSTFMDEFIKEKNGESTNTQTSARSWFAMMDELRKITEEENATPVIVNRTYYVSEIGDNSNSGSKSSPFKTLARAINVCESRDTIRIDGIVECSNVVLTNNIVLTIIGNDKNTSILQPSSTKESSTSRVLSFINTDTIYVKNLTIRWGNVVNDANNKFGGNIYIENSIVNLDNVNVLEGKATRGGGIYVNGTRNRGTVTHSFVNCNISDNESTAGGGGGIFITSNRWNDNRTVIRQSLISGNVASLENTLGGGIYLEPYVIDEFEGTGKLCNLTVENSTLFNNSATNGGGIATGFKNITSNISLINNTIAYNKGTASTNNGAGPGGISNRVTSKIAFTLINNLICMNTGLKWGDSSPTLYDATFSGITLRQADHNIFTNNIPESALNYSQKPPVGNQYKENSFILLDDKLTDNGGANMTLKFTNNNSVAINAGLNLPSIVFDQRGFRRDNQTDVGAFEYDAVSSVNMIDKNQILRFSSNDQTLFIGKDGTYDIYIHDVAGKKVYQKINLRSDSLKLPLLNTGMAVYLITALNKDTREKQELKILL